MTGNRHSNHSGERNHDRHAVGWHSIRDLHARLGRRREWSRDYPGYDYSYDYNYDGLFSDSLWSHERGQQDKDVAGGTGRFKIAYAQPGGKLRIRQIFERV